MKKTLLAALVAVASLAQAHELWVNAPAKIAADEVLKADLAYGHDYPTAEPIEADRLHIFKPLQLIGMDGKAQDMNQQGENYQYVSKEKLGKGAYWVSAIYQPTFWSKNDSGWKQQNLKDMPDASTCQQAQMFGKALVVAGDDAVDVAAVSKPVGQALEIVPLANPNSAKVGKLFPVRILFQGKPLADEIVTATADTIALMDEEATHDHREPQIFSGKTDKEGKVNIIPLVEGFWKVKVKHKTPFANQKQCHENSLSATLAMQIGTKRVDISKPHAHD